MFGPIEPIRRYIRTRCETCDVEFDAVLTRNQWPIREGTPFFCKDHIEAYWEALEEGRHVESTKNHPWAEGVVAAVFDKDGDMRHEFLTKEPLP